MEKEIETELCRTGFLATLLTLDPTSSRQPPKDGDKCHNIAHFPPLNLLLVHDIGQIRLEVREQGDPLMWSEKFSSPGTAGWIRVESGFGGANGRLQQHHSQLDFVVSALIFLISHSAHSRFPVVYLL